VGVKYDLRSQHYRQPNQLRITPLVTNDRSADHPIDAEQSQRIPPREEFSIARREMYLVVTKRFASLSIEYHQRVEPSPASKSWRTDQNVATVGSRRLRNSQKPEFNL